MTSPKAVSGKVIISCAVTGAIHTPSMSPHLPVTPDEIVADALKAAEAGAAILHLHARNPQTGRPDQTPEAFGRFLGRVKQGTNAVVNITTGGLRTGRLARPDRRPAGGEHDEPELRRPGPRYRLCDLDSAGGEGRPAPRARGGRALCRPRSGRQRAAGGPV